MKRKQYKVSEAQIPMFDFDHPHMPVLDVSRCEARLINYETAARMVETYHYAHRVPVLIFAIGLFVDGILSGVCTYSKPMASVCDAICGKEYSDNVLELSRLFIHDWCGRNAESWLIGQSFRFLGNDRILLSYSDTSQNHLGIIYQATNWLYTGISSETDSREYQLTDGTITTRRADAFKVSTKRGLGRIMPWEEIQALYPGIKRVQSSLKHRYVYFLGNKRQRRILRQALKWPILPYPKGKQIK